MPAPSSERPPWSYCEHLRVPASWWLVGIMLAVSLWWIFVLATPMWFAVGVAVVSGAGIVTALWSYGNATVEVTNLHLRAGAARIPLTHCGDVQPLDAEETRALHGRDADARAFFLVRPYVGTSVRVEITDPRDPTPYWLVSTRHPERVADTLAARRP